jgi:hypothetical protein
LVSYVILDYYRIAEGRIKSLNLINFLPVSPVLPIYCLVADLQSSLFQTVDLEFVNTNFVTVFVTRGHSLFWGV